MAASDSDVQLQVRAEAAQLRLSPCRAPPSTQSGDIQLGTAECNYMHVLLIRKVQHS